MYLSSVVYAPPAQGLPHLAVLFGRDGEILAARPMVSLEAGERFIADTDLEIAEKHGLQVKSQKI
jgi:hypothetical protein